MSGLIIVVGAGLSGATIAERYASIGKRVLVLEKRDHIAGNCYDHLAESGILVSKYGAHIFHTQDSEVWEYVNRFAEFNDYQHKVVSSVGGKLVPVPVNIDTVNSLFGENISTPDEMEAWLQNEQVRFSPPKNSEEAALSRVGRRLYELMFKNYTLKQWDMEPKELEPEVMQRIPVRNNHDGRYFSDDYEGIPTDGYTKMVENMLDHPNIEVRVGTDFLEISDTLPTPEKIFYTGPIDAYFNNRHEKLQYRSLRFEFEELPVQSYQENSVVNYPSDEQAFTRIVEFNKFYNKPAGSTVIAREYPTWDGEPYYPVPTQRNRDLYAKYKKLADEERGVIFVGRLANYKYFNMDAAVRNALDVFDEQLKK